MSKSFIIYQSSFESGFDTLAEATAAAEQLKGSRWFITREAVVARCRPLQESKTGKSLQWYLTLGEALSKVAPMFPSTKLYGQHVAATLPESQALDAALRSNCKWLFEHQDEVIRVLLPEDSSLQGYKSSNPTVIRRAYNAAVRKAKKEGKKAGFPL